MDQLSPGQAASASKTHPILIIAGTAVTLLCITGIAAIIGWLPNSGAKSADSAALTPPPAAQAQATLPAPAPVVAQAAPAPQAEVASPPPPAPPKHKAAAPKPVAPKAVAAAPAPAPAHMYPPPQEAVAQYAPPPPPPPVAVAKPICHECGVVENIREVEQKGEASAVGTIAGGVGGALLGNQVGNGNGRTAMTVLGAVGGALAGREIEKNVKKTKSYAVDVRLEDGTTKTISSSTVPGWRIGDKVRVVNGEIVSNS
jgi:outer membrane lipoprotein SlyB